MSAKRRLRVPSSENGIVRCAWCGTHEIEDYTLRDGSVSFYCSWGCYKANPLQYKNVKRKSLLTGLITAFVMTIIIALMFQLDISEVLLLTFIILMICPGCVYLGCIDGAVRAEEYRKNVPEGSRYKEYVGSEKPIEIFDAITCPICSADVDRSSFEPGQTIHCEFCGANLERREK